MSDSPLTSNYKKLLISVLQHLMHDWSQNHFHCKAHFATGYYDGIRARHE
jgi:hypothetical protein